MVPCRHCQVPTEAADGFCCLGCRAAYTLVVDAGLERAALYADGPLPRGGTPQPRPWLDAAPQGHVVVDVQGITCGACVWSIETLAKRRGVQAQVNPGIGRIVVDVAADAAAAHAFFDDVETLGYRLGPPNKSADRQTDGLVLRAGMSAAAAMMAMSFAFSRYFGLDDSVASGGFAHVFLVAEFFAALFAVVVGGSFFFASAWRSLRLGIVAFDVPIALGIVLAFAGSVVAVLLGGSGAGATNNGVFFDSVTMFVALMIGGRLAQRSVVARSRAQLLDDTGLLGLPVTVLRDQTPVIISAASVHAGDRLLVKPGDAVPVDAVVEDGQAAFSFAWITGEADTKSLAVGAAVPAGACHSSGPAVVAVAQQDGRDSRLAQLLSRREEDIAGAAGGWRRFSELYVFFVIAAAVVGGVVHAFFADAAAGVAVATAVLVVTCPCAFGLALPLVDELAVAALRRRGVYVRRAGFFERLRHVRDVVLDKTGTLTAAEQVLSTSGAQALTSLSGADKDALFQLVARSGHPKSVALTRALGLRPLATGAVVDEVAGVGLTAALASGRYTLQKPDDDSGALLFAKDGAVRAVFSFDEELQPDALAEVQGLLAQGVRVHIASGDHAARARAVAARLGVDVDHVHAGLAPEDKAALVEGLGKDGVLFVGDGINDAPAFNVAAVAGTAALERPQLPSRADFYTLARGGLSGSAPSGGVGPLNVVLGVGRAWARTSGVVVAAATLYNAVAVVLALLGLLSPLACALLMPASSVVIVVLARTVWSASSSATAAQGDPV